MTQDLELCRAAGERWARGLDLSQLEPLALNTDDDGGERSLRIACRISETDLLDDDEPAFLGDNENTILTFVAGVVAVWKERTARQVTLVKHFPSDTEAGAWCRGEQLDIGSMASGSPRGLRRGYSIAKWYNLDADDRAQLDGVLEYDREESLSTRDPPVTITMYQPWLSLTAPEMIPQREAGAAWARGLSREQMIGYAFGLSLRGYKSRHCDDVAGYLADLMWDALSTSELAALGLQRRGDQTPMIVFIEGAAPVWKEREAAGETKLSVRETEILADLVGQEASPAELEARAATYQAHADELKTYLREAETTHSA